MAAYAELHCLSAFSFLRGASQPAELVARAAELGYTALAITDECSLAGVVRAYEAMRALPEGASLKLIIGAEFITRDGALRLVLLAPTQAAYTEICRLITRARRRARKGQYQLEQADFGDGLDECLALWLPPLRSGRAGADNGGGDGNDRTATAEAQGHWLRAHFPGRCWLVVELHRGVRDAARLAECRQLAAACQLPAVAAGDVHMHRRARRPLQDVLTATRHRCTVAEAGWRLFPNGERHLRSIAALEKAYPTDLLAETLVIAGRCSFSLGSLRYEYPAELVPAGLSAAAHLGALVAAGQQRRWGVVTPPAAQALIDKELALISELGYEHYFLTVHDLVAFARERGILCQGRGSAANSAVCYALGITEVDPARMNMLFERFISRERREPPDIDVDFEHERREEVMQYLYNKYGRGRTALTATVISYRGRSARRDVARALGFTPGTAPPPAQAALFDMLVSELRGLPRHLSQHVGGFVISGTPLHELVPVENAAMPERTVIQWDKDDLDVLGLLKVDVLALGMLTAIRKCLAYTTQYRGWPARMQDIPPDDEATYSMIGRAETMGVFQIESRAQMSMLPRLKPRCFYDLVIEVAIVRPGPIQGGMVHPYLQRRNDPASVSYPSPALEQVLSRTLGVPIFQEQVMQIAVVAADFTPGEADQLRRSMAAWKRKGGLEPFRERLLTGMRRNGYSEEFATRIYQQILGFGEYGFPESHAASFALLTYVSCWLKCHEPAAFFAALLNSQPMGFYMPAQLLQEARRAGVNVLPPDVQHSDWDYTLENRGQSPISCMITASAEKCGKSGTVPDFPALAIRIGLRQVRSLNEADARRVLAARAAGAFTGIDDLCARAALNRRAVQRLAAAGALRSLTTHRHDAHWRALGIESLPPLIVHAAATESAAPLPVPTEAQEILADFRQLGLSTGRHPLALLRPWLRERGLRSSQDIRTLPDGSRVHVGGLVTHLQQPGTASGVTFISLEDEHGIANVICWAQVFAREYRAAQQASLLVVSGKLQHHDNVIHVIAERLHDRSHWLATLPRRSRDYR
jgi:error-prone DNA polymerase